MVASFKIREGSCISWRSIAASVALSFLLLLSACSGTAISKKSAGGNAKDQAIKPIKEQPPALSADWYATAIDRHKPLGRIIGNAKPLSRNQIYNGRFDKVIEYAASQQSYSLLIWQGGDFVLEHYFPPYTDNLKPESASMHKSVLALLVAAAIADGHIRHADQRIGDFLDDWATDPRGDITIRQLLTMSSGLKPLESQGGKESQAYQYWFNGADARRTLLGLPLEHEPGTVFYYQDTLPGLLVLILEAATGQTYQRYLSERLWKRIGADDAHVWLNEETGFPRGYTELMAQARDWLRIGLLIKDHGSYDGDQIIPASLMRQASAPSTTNPNYAWLTWRGESYQAVRYYNQFNIGVGVMASAPYKVDDFLFFDGFGGQRVFVSRSKDLVIVRLGALQPGWDDAILPNLVIDALD